MHRQTLNPDSVFDTLQYGFSQAVISQGGRRIHLSGQIGVDAQERLVGEDLASQTVAALHNVRKILEHAGGSMTDVLVLRIYIAAAARDEQACIVGALREFFPERPPATSWIVVTGLSEPEWLIEIEAEALLPDA
ncbi:RidA family protein [Pseudomonas sp. MM211]|uniref:RidA family protein n=1 Tax=Pseudomonas sp. MM211 TaxID=2866808 RepID=UPI001CEC2B7B|nr:RidA family protein [Pseudomonas sp. MM211]UCJ18576.1 RidA family protein [Pseudomonas sp. MM211]